MARYGTLKAWAGQLEMEDAAKLLRETLEQEKSADPKLSELALGALNEEAEGDEGRAVDDLKAEAERLVGLAKSRKLTLLTVESCTAGALACALANAKGAGDVLHGGFVVYTKENKCAAVVFRLS